MGGPPPEGLSDLLALRTLRRFLALSGGRAMAACIAIVYGLIALVEGGMLNLQAIAPPYGGYVLWTSANGQFAWNYPGLVIVQPHWDLILPFFPTVAMVLVSLGVGLGMAAAILLAAKVLSRRATSVAAPSAASSLAGVTPAMIAAVTLGACCSTTAAATAGVGLVAQATGTTVSNLLLNNWFLGLFQIVIVWVTLFAQELLLVVYGGLVGDPSASPAVTAPPVTLRSVVRGLARFVLLTAGVVWSLQMFVQWTIVAPGSAGAGLWVNWLLQHQFLAGIAIVAGLFPDRLLGFLGGASARLSQTVVRAALLVGGLSVLAYLPPPLPSWGLEGWINDLLGYLGAPHAWGAIAPVGPLSAGVVVRWIFQILLVGGFAVAVALAPYRTIGPLTPARPADGSDRAPSGGETAHGAPSPSGPGEGAPTARAPSDARSLPAVPGEGT